MLGQFEYRSPRSIEETLELLGKHREDARILAGGHSLLPAMKQGDVSPKVLIDLRRVAGLSTIDAFDEGGFRIGALVTHQSLEVSDLVRARCPLLARVASQIGDTQVRNFGTLAGSICHSDPASDPAAALLALDAQVVVASPRGERSVPIDGFLQGAFQTALEPDELVVAVELLRSWATTSAYVKVSGSASTFPLAGAAVQIEMASGHIEEARIGVSAVTDRSFRAQAAEARLRDCEPTKEALEEAIAGVAQGLEVIADLAASAQYRAHLAEVCVRRAINAAISRIGG